MTLDHEEVTILIHESALDAMVEREQRMLRQFRRLQEDLNDLGNAIREKKFKIAAARDRLLRRVM